MNIEIQELLELVKNNGDAHLIINKVEEVKQLLDWNDAERYSAYEMFDNVEALETFRLMNCVMWNAKSTGVDMPKWNAQYISTNERNDVDDIIEVVTIINSIDILLSIDVSKIENIEDVTDDEIHFIYSQIHYKDGNSSCEFPLLSRTNVINLLNIEKIGNNKVPVFKSFDLDNRLN